MNIARRKGRALKRRVPGQMTKTEERFAAILAARKAAGEICEFWYESVKLRLADKTWYTADFAIVHVNGMIELVEVKGSAGWNAPNQDMSRVKLKVAAEQHWWILFSAEVEIPKKKGGGWHREEIGP